MITTLSISHNIFLSKEERYDLFDGKKLSIVGVSVPVWTFNGMSSEPAIEVFAKYEINQGEVLSIIDNRKEFIIEIPKTPSKLYEPLSDDVWKNLAANVKERWYQLNEPKGSLINLLDIEDGGSAYLHFKQYSKVNMNNKVIGLLHFVELKPMEELLTTLI